MPRHIPAASLALAALSALAPAQNRILIAEGDVLPNGTIVQDVRDVVVSDGGHWAALVDLGDGSPQSPTAIVVDGQVLVATGDVLPGGITYSTNARTIDIAPDGRVLWTSLAGVFLDHTPIAIAGGQPTAPELGPEITWNLFFGSRFDGAGGFITALRLESPGPDDSALVRFLPGASMGFDQSVVATNSDLFPGSQFGIGLVVASLPRAFAANASSVAFQVDSIAGAGLIVDDQPMALVGEQSPAFFADWQTLREYPIELNPAGDLAYAGRVESAIEEESFEILVWNGLLVAREGGPVPSIAPCTIERLALEGSAGAPLRLDAAGSVYWYADWDDTDQGRDEGLFRDFDLVLREGTTKVEGHTLESLTPVSLSGLGANFDVTEDGSQIALRAGLDDGRRAAVLVDVSASVFPLPGCAPFAGTLNSGPFAVGTSPVITLSAPQAPGALGFMALSTASTVGAGGCGVDLPGLGEVLIDLAAPALIGVYPAALPGGFGGLTDIPVAIGAVPDEKALIGIELFGQGVWIDVPGLAPGEFARLTNGLRMVVQS